MYTILTREIERGGGGERGKREGEREGGERERGREVDSKACASFEHWYFNNKTSQFSPVYN